MIKPTAQCRTATRSGSSAQLLGKPVSVDLGLTAERLGLWVSGLEVRVLGSYLEAHTLPLFLRYPIFYINRS